MGWRGLGYWFGLSGTRRMGPGSVVLLESCEGDTAFVFWVEEFFGCLHGVVCTYTEVYNWAIVHATVCAEFKGFEIPPLRH